MDDHSVYVFSRKGRTLVNRFFRFSYGEDKDTEYLLLSGPEVENIYHVCIGKIPYKVKKVENSQGVYTVVCMVTNACRTCKYRLICARERGNIRNAFYNISRSGFRDGGVVR